MASWNSLNSVSALFSNFGKSQATNSLYSNLSQLSSIRSGNYYKLTKKYYSNIEDTDSSDKSNRNDKTKKEYDYFDVLSVYRDKSSLSVSKDSTKNLSLAKEASDGMKESADKLLTTTSKSVFAKDSKGAYDTDKIYSAVKDFVDGYNDVIDKTKNLKSSTITSYEDGMERKTSTYSGMLAKVGISLNDDGTLALDEKKFKEADMDKVKSLFNGNRSYGYQMAVSASMISDAATNEAKKASTYTGSANFSNTYGLGSLFDSSN